MLFATRRLLNAAFFGLAMAVAASPASTPAQTVSVEVANAGELATSGSDAALVGDLLKALEETDLWHLEAGRSQSGIDVLQRTILCISLASPEKPTETKSQNTTIQLSPINDFNAFVDAIDYGQVLSRDDQRRVVRVKVRPEEIDQDRLRQRLAEFEKQGAYELGHTLLGDLPNSFIPHAAFGGDSADEPSADRLGGLIAPDDYVEILLGGEPCVGQVTMTQRKFGKDTACVLLTDTTNLERVVRSRRLKTRLGKAESISVWAPLERLRKVPGPPAVKPVERTWTDITGKFKVVATFGGVDGDKVVLKKPAGNEIRVPLAKLCDADRDYANELLAAEAANANPFADQPAADAPGSLRTDWSAIKQVRPKASRKWTFHPPKARAVTPAELKVTALEVSRPPDVGAFGEDLKGLFVADDGSSAAVAVSPGHTDERLFVQRLDFVTGVAEPMLACPEGSKVLDIDPVQRIVLLGTDDFTSNAAKVYVSRMERDRLVPVCDWDAQPPNTVHKGLEAARVLGGGRVMTQTKFGPWIVWGANTGKAEFLIDLDGNRDDAIELAYGRRLLIADGDDAVVIVDLVSGKHLASLPHRLNRLDRVTVNPELTRLAIAVGELAAVVDLNSGEVLQAIQGGLLQRAEIDFMGELLLIDNKYLVEPTYPVLLWEYLMARDSAGDYFTKVVGDRLWYAVRNPAMKAMDHGPWNVVAIPAPHNAVKERLANLGDLDKLVILDEGDEVAVEVDTDLDAEKAEQIKAALTQAAVNAGYKVVDGPAEKKLIAICRADDPIEVQIADPDATPPADRPLARHMPVGIGGPLGDWRLVKRTLRPYQNVVVLRRNDETLWANGYQVRAGAKFYPRGEEKVDDVVRRITTPDLEGLVGMSLPGRLCRRGDATPSGAYGVSLLDAEGVVEDKIGEAVAD